MPRNVLTSNKALVGHAPLPQDHSNMPYPLAMYPHHPYDRPHQPYSYDSAAYPFTYHLHGEYPSFGMAYSASDPSSRGDVIPASIKYVSGVDEQRHSSSFNSAETSSFHVPPSSSERHSGVPVGGPRGLWYAASNHMIPGATQPHHYGNYQQGRMHHPYKAASTAYKYTYNMQPVDSSTSGVVSHHAGLSRDSGAAFDYIEPVGSAKQAMLGLSFTTSSDQMSGRTGSFSTSRTESEEGPDDMTADTPSFSGMYSNASNFSQSTSDLRMSGMTSKRARKNELARQRSIKIKEHIEDILNKPVVAITSEDASIFHHYEAKRLMNNERSRNLAKGKKHKIMAIRLKPLYERTREEQMYLERAMKAKFRKNEGDRLRRLRAKESSPL